MKILYLADVVGKPGRTMIKHHLQSIKKEHSIDLVIINAENASHGFGLSVKNANELFAMGIDMMTGGNHSWDKRDIMPLLESEPILRPINYPESAPGKGVGYLQLGEEKLAVVNLMGHYTMPMVDNPFTMIVKEVERLREEGYQNIFIDMHAEATSEKRALMAMLKGKVSAICGSHTHIGTDDLEIDEGTFYVTDVGLTGCRDGVIGMDKKQPMERFLTSISSKFDVPNSCKKLLQGVVFELEEGKCKEAYKVKAYDYAPATITQRAYCEQ
ncbi:MAG: YmdB family metallophosphoesterase [Epsilonproteobacteria bacterium]|nr:YmdB family metallophosphoesterase [Campylobacterota bacterium]